MIIQNSILVVSEPAHQIKYGSLALRGGREAALHYVSDYILSLWKWYGLVLLSYLRYSWVGSGYEIIINFQLSSWSICSARILEVIQGLRESPTWCAISRGQAFALGRPGRCPCVLCGGDLIKDPLLKLIRILKALLEYLKSFLDAVDVVLKLGNTALYRPHVVLLHGRPRGAAAAVGVVPVGVVWHEDALIVVAMGRTCLVLTMVWFYLADIGRYWLLAMGSNYRRFKDLIGDVPRNAMEGRYDVLAVGFVHELVASLSQGYHLGCRCELCRGQDWALMTRILSQMFHFLLIVEHKPTLGA